MDVINLKKVAVAVHPENEKVMMMTKKELYYNIECIALTNKMKLNGFEDVQQFLGKSRNLTLKYFRWKKTTMRFEKVIQL